jgi:hypothetical protein
VLVSKTSLPPFILILFCKFNDILIILFYTSNYFILMYSKVSGSSDDAPKVRKDVLAGNIGKLYIPEQLQAAMQAASEAASLPIPNANVSYRSYLWGLNYHF